MKVFNLTRNDIDYRGRRIQANGGFQDYPELEKGFIPTRDRALESLHMLSFGALPKGWTPPVVQVESLLSSIKTPPPMKAVIEPPKEGPQSEPETKQEETKPAAVEFFNKKKLGR